MYLIRKLAAPTTKKCAQIIKNLTTSSTDKILSVVTEQINPASQITIANCNFNLKIKPNDILDPNDVNSLRATLITANSQSAPDVSVHFEVNGQTVTINSSSSVEDNITCILEVPVKSDLNVQANRNVHVEKMYSEAIRLMTKGNISTKNLQGFAFDFESEHGNIHCGGNTLANQINIRTRGNGNIHLDKVQGDIMFAICDSGCISTDSCYAEASKFVSLNGKLHLKNVHKFAEMYLLEKGGELDVSGFHGTLMAKTNGGRLRYQLTEVYGDSCIEAMGEPEELVVNVSDFVVDNVSMEMRADDIVLDESIAYLSGCVLEKGVFRLEHENLELSNDRLTVNTAVQLRLGKMSWADTVRLKMNKNN